MARAAPDPRTVTLAIAGPLERDALPALLERTCALLARDGVELLRCEVSAVAADSVAVDALCRLALVARRRGVAVRMSGASAQLCALIALIGLDGVLAAEPPR